MQLVPRISKTAPDMRPRWCPRHSTLLCYISLSSGSWWEPHVWGVDWKWGRNGAKNYQFGSRFLQNVRVHMDSGKDYFFGHSYSLFWLPNWAFLGVMASSPDLRFHKSPFPGLRFHQGMDQFINARMMVSNLTQQELRMLSSAQLIGTLQCPN